MAALRGLLRSGHTREAGFTIIEAVVAAGILVIAIVLTVTPLVISMRTIDRSKDVTIAESLAQARIEQIRAMQFGDVGHPGVAPAGILNPFEVETVEGANYRIETRVEYVGSASGLNVIPQGGDGVEGAFDIGVNYKYIRVTVTPLDGEGRPVMMETFVSPPTVGAQENIALVQVDVIRHEPFDPSADPGPYIRLSGPQIYTSPDALPAQYFPDIATGTYTIGLATTHGWLIHPESIATGATSVDAVPGVAATRTIRVYQPVALEVEVLDDTTGLPITDAVITVDNLAYGGPITNPAGDYAFPGLVPDRHAVTAAAVGYAAATVEVDVPGFGGSPTTSITMRLKPQAFVGVDHDFYVDYRGWSNYYIHGASVTVSHPVHGTFVGTTDETGHVIIELPVSETGFTATASTTWGHAPASISLSTGSTPGSSSLSLGKPATTDRFALRNGGPGPQGFFEYKVGSDAWIRVEANDQGRATFILPEDDGTVVRIQTYCSPADYPGEPAATTSTTLNGRNKSWNASVTC